MLSYVVQFPFVFSLHKDDVVQFFSVSTREIGSVNLKKMIRASGDEEDHVDFPEPKGPSPRPPSLDEQRHDPGSIIDIVPMGNTGFRSTVLLVTPDNEVTVVRSHEDFYSVYLIAYHSESTSLVLQRKARLEPLGEDSNSEDSSASSSSYGSVLRLVESCCKLWNGHLILGNSNVRLNLAGSAW